MHPDAEHNLPFAVGDVLLDKYRIDRVLGVGGMGVVLAATHLDLDSQVAIKVMRGELLGSESAVQRLLLEAKAAAKIKSEHVARVLDVGRLPEGAPYIVMEFLDGCDLGQLLSRNGALSVQQSVDYVLEACEALAQAHAAQIIHRDLKPENLFVATLPDGTRSIKVVDFGISKQLGQSATGPALTNPSSAVGSPQYMAPEQMQARAVDVRADVWALGTILYQCVSGKYAFDGDTLPEVCAKVLGEDPPPLGSVRPDVPPALEAIVARCLRKDPTQRYPDVAALAAELAPFGSAGALRSLERITRVLRGPVAVAAGFTAASTAQRGAAGFAPTVATPLTGASTYPQFANQPPNKGRSRVLPGLLIVLAVVLFAVVWLIRASGDTPLADDTLAQETLAQETAPAPAAPSPPEEPAPSEPAAEPSASAAPTPSVNPAPPEPKPVVSVAPAPHPAPAPRPAPRPAAKPAPAPQESNAQKAWDLENFGGRR